MKYHILLSRHFDLERFEQEALIDKSPRHTLRTLSLKLNAIVHDPSEYVACITSSDRMLSRLTGGSKPQHWAMARTLAAKLSSDDIVFCIGEDSGYPIAAMCDPQNRPKIAVLIHNANRPRSRLAMKLFKLASRIDLFITNTAAKADFLRQYLNITSQQVYLLDEQTDTRFFTPGSESTNKQRPIIGSGGLEQRDYCTLALATHNLDVDVKVCAVSPTARTYPDTFPNVLPKNMSCDYYDWQNLRQLYRDSDVVVISLKPHNFQAGFATLFEAMACRRPVVMTRTPGLAEKFANAGVIIGVQPGNAEEMSQAITYLLEHPQEAEVIAQKGYELVQQYYNSEQYVKTLAEKLVSLASTSELVMSY
ncbi:MAG: glycosyltransferase family 4 protein [Microcoleaceae cyanobacterium]